MPPSVSSPHIGVDVSARLHINVAGLELSFPFFFYSLLTLTTYLLNLFQPITSRQTDCCWYLLFLACTIIPATISLNFGITFRSLSYSFLPFVLIAFLFLGLCTIVILPPLPLSLSISLTSSNTFLIYVPLTIPQLILLPRLR